MNFWANSVVIRSLFSFSDWFKRLSIFISCSFYRLKLKNLKINANFLIGTFWDANRYIPAFVSKFKVTVENGQTAEFFFLTAMTAATAPVLYSHGSMSTNLIWCMSFDCTGKTSRGRVKDGSQFSIIREYTRIKGTFVSVITIALSVWSISGFNHNTKQSQQTKNVHINSLLLCSFV